MDNMHARMRVPEREAAKASAAPVHEESSRYVSPNPPAAEAKRNKKSRLPKWGWFVLALAIIAGIIFGAWKLFLTGTSADGIDKDKYQAVFLSSDSLPSNVYFGKLERMDDGYYKLTKVYYLQNPDENESQDTTSLTVVRVAKQVHSPQDEMVVPREQVMYYQNMTDDSKVVQYIKQDLEK